MRPWFGCDRFFPKAPVLRDWLPTELQGREGLEGSDLINGLNLLIDSSFDNVTRKYWEI